MVDLLDRFESEDVSRGLAATGRASQGKGGVQDRAPVNPFDEIEIGSLSTVSDIWTSHTHTRPRRPPTIDTRHRLASHYSSVTRQGFPFPLVVSHT